MNRLLFIIILVIPLPINLLSQNSIFDNNGATIGSIRNMSQFASIESDAVVYNPAGLAFSEKELMVSCGGIVSYQRVSNWPFNNNSDGKIENDLMHVSSVCSLIPSFQIAYRKGRTSFSASYANEGGGGVWKDHYGNYVMDVVLHSFEHIINSMQQTFHSQIDTLRFYSMNYRSDYYNRCLRTGVSIRIGEHCSSYVGLKTNHIFFSSNCSGGLFVKRKTTQERWLLSEYYETQSGVIGENDAIPDLDSLVNAVSSSINIKAKKLLCVYSPVIGFDFNYNRFNCGLKYEISPSFIHNNEEITLPHNLSFGASVLLLKNKLNVSAGANFQWGFQSDYESVLRVSKNVGVVYNIVAGAELSPVDRVNFCLSASFGNQYLPVRDLGICMEAGDISSLKLSFGLGYDLNNHFKADMGFMVIPSFGYYNITMNTNIFSNTSTSVLESHCVYEYHNRYSIGFGLTCIL